MWRAFVGSWGGGRPEWADIDLTVEGWETARRAVTDWVRFDAEWAQPWRGQYCSDCAAQVGPVLAELGRLGSGSEFTGQFDNRDLIIRRIVPGG